MICRRTDGHGRKLVAGLFDRVFQSQPVEQRALGLLLTRSDSHLAPNEMGANLRSALFELPLSEPKVLPVCGYAGTAQGAECNETWNLFLTSMSVGVMNAIRKHHHNAALAFEHDR